MNEEDYELIFRAVITVPNSVTIKGVTSDLYISDHQKHQTQSMFKEN